MAILAQAFYLPPATGFRQSLDIEFGQLRAAGIVAEVISPVDIDLLLAKMPRSLANPFGEIAYWRRYAQIVEDQILLKATSNSLIFLVGFNFGGSLAAYSAQRLSLSGLIASGSIPRLSAFWQHSMHPVAIAARAKGEKYLAAYSEKLYPFDLTSSVKKLALPTLMQFGTEDDWIDRAEVAELESLGQERLKVSWFEDDHDMAGTACMAERCSFLTKIITEN